MSSTEDKVKAWLAGDLDRKLEITSHVDGFRVTFVEEYTKLTSATDSTILAAAANSLPSLVGAKFRQLKAEHARLSEELQMAQQCAVTVRSRLEAVSKKMRVLQNEVLAGKEAP